MSQINDESMHAEDCAEFLKALAHPLRLRIVAMLCEGEESVGQLAERLDVQPSAVSQQLRILRMHHLVGVTRRGGFAVYWLANPDLRELVECVHRCGSN